MSQNATTPTMTITPMMGPTIIPMFTFWEDGDGDDEGDDGRDGM
jgi:hypothetical protein